MTRLPAEVLDRTSRYLDAVDEALPGLVSALYVVGSAALGAWQQGRSDVDMVIVTSRPFGADDLGVLEKIHAAVPKTPKLDGIYVDQDLFDHRPVDQRVVSFVANGELRTDKPCGELNPVVWLILQRHGGVVRGPRVKPHPLPSLGGYLLDNLRHVHCRGPHCPHLSG